MSAKVNYTFYQFPLPLWEGGDDCREAGGRATHGAVAEGEGEFLIKILLPKTLTPPQKKWGRIQTLLLDLSLQATVRQLEHLRHCAPKGHQSIAKQSEFTHHFCAGGYLNLSAFCHSKPRC